MFVLLVILIKISELETDIYNFIRKLCLTFHFLIKLMKTNQLLEMCLHLKSKAIENQELKAICRNSSETKINMKRTSDNISNLQRVIQNVHKMQLGICIV